MARYDKDHKRQTRERIIEAAGRRLKADGIDGSGVSTLMADAGLTNGAFYAHFASKEDLVGAAVTEELRRQTASFLKSVTTREDLAQFVKDYLSPEHRDHRVDGCPSAALLDELGRCDTATRRAYTAAMGELLAKIADVIGDPGPATRVKVSSAYALMIGTIQLSRTLTDPKLADDILEEGVRNVLRILGLNSP
ncbi:TetR/AcrR family transcriptional regulator [Microlunatus parietis]|uniref:AcrR family transcriptional regulator n=1 Tax=Microlunatus parietis TaxID=682979 RepID=A0A7Y9I2F2_9ACTN|nr:TetR/AcrR family transcriptional regulator [Microlunatus parietis]NYE68689.1 AcrR family transcriptional regulator [Microlunatus parietis]